MSRPENAAGPAARMGGAGPSEDRPAAHVLADRVASALVHHEPGWRLPRRSALARRYGVSPVEMEAAIEELAARHLLRRLPDGQVYRASPADYLIQLEGQPDLKASIDPMGMSVVCASRHVSVRRVADDIGGALGLPPGDSVCVVRCLWTSGGDPAAFSATYLPVEQPVPDGSVPTFADVLKAPQSVLAPVPPDQQQAPPVGPAHPAGLYVELQPPAPSVARSLRLPAGQPAVNVTIRYDSAEGCPVALATAVLRPDLFRVVVESPQPPPPASLLAGDDDDGWTNMQSV
jgi:DNA-binding GntR family transcriptional regulator